MKLFTTISYCKGLEVKQRRIDFTSDAHTRKGLLRALGKAIADELGTDTFEVYGRKLIAISNRHRSPHVVLTFGHDDDRYVWGVANDALMA